VPRQLGHATNASQAPSLAPRRRSIGISLLAIEKACGACFFQAAATTLLVLHARNVTHPLQVLFAAELREDPHDAAANLLIGFLPQVSTTALLTLGLVALGDMLLHAIEAAGLWLGQLWVEYLILIETAGLLPYEAYEIVRHLTPFKLLAFGINLVIVAYLARRRLRSKSARAATKLASMSD